MNRRQLLQLGLPAGLAAAGFGVHRVLVPPRRSRVLAPVPELTTRLIDGLEGEQRAAGALATELIGRAAARLPAGRKVREVVVAHLERSGFSA